MLLLVDIVIRFSLCQCLSEMLKNQKIVKQWAINSLNLDNTEKRSKSTSNADDSSPQDTPHGLPNTRAFNPDIILEQLGPIGWFQIKFILCVGYGLLFPTAVILMYTFVGGVPAHRCFIEGCDDSTHPDYKAEWMNVSQEIFNNLVANPRTWRCAYKDFSVMNNTSLPSCAKNYTVNATCSNWVFDSSIFERTIVNEYLLVCENKWKVTFGLFITMLGVLFGGFFLGPLPDLIGRRKSIVILGIWMSSFGLASCFSPNFELFACLRFFTGMGGVAVIQALIIWGLEAMSPSMRVKFICITYCFQSLGNLISGWLAYLIRYWGIFGITFSNDPLFNKLSRLITDWYRMTVASILPESTRWLTVKKRYSEAKTIYEKAAQLNKREIPPQLLIIPTEDDSSITSDSQDADPMRSGILIFKTRTLLVRLGVLCSTWLAQFVCYYGLSYAASNLSSDVYLNYILIMVVEFPAFAIGFFTMDLIGRRLILNITLIGGGIFCLVAGLVPKDYYSVIVTFSLLGKFCTSLLKVTNNAFTFELFPTISRGITLAICSTSGKIGSIIAPFIVGLGETNRSTPYIILGAISFSVGLLTLLLPETKGLPAPDTIQEAIDLDRTRLNFAKLCGRKKTAPYISKKKSAVQISTLNLIN